MFSREPVASALATGSRLNELFYLAVGEVAEIVEQIRQRRHELLPVPLVQTLVRRMRVALRVLDTQQQRRGAAEQLREWADEANRAAAANANRVGLERLLLCVHRRTERRPRRIGHPPLHRRTVRLDRDLGTPGRI